MDFDIWKVLEHYGWELPQPRGVWQTVKCYAHKDSHSSCRINSDINRVKCMACDFAGDTIDVIKHYEGVEFKDAVSIAERITGTSRDSVSRATGSKRSGSRVSDGTGNRSRGGSYTPPRLRRSS